MLSSNLQTLLENRLRYLPEITGRAINSIDWPTTLIEVGHKHGLHIDEMDEFQAVVLKAMTGLIAPDHFESELISATAVSPTTAENMINEINEKIFEPIHNFVMSGGKPKIPEPNDPLKAAGIVIDSGPEPEVQEFLSVPKPPLPVAETTEMELPTSPEPIPQPPTKPFVQGKFEDYFINVPKQTNQTMGK